MICPKKCFNRKGKNMKRFLNLTGIGIALALILTGCNEAPDSAANANAASVVAADKAGQSSVSEASVSTKAKTDESAEQEAISIAESSAANVDLPESTAEAPEYGDHISANDEFQSETGNSPAPKDYIPDAVCEVEVTMKKIVDLSITVEVLEENIAEYNADNQNGVEYSVTAVNVFDDDEKISSGLLKDGMCVRVDFGSGGYTEYRVTRAPKDVIPDAVYERESALTAIVAGSKTVEELQENIAEYNAGSQNGEAYSVTKVTFFDDGEEVSSGLLKDGMYVRVDFGSDGYTEYRVTRAPKDCIPDNAELPVKNAANDASESIAAS